MPPGGAAGGALPEPATSGWRKALSPTSEFPGQPYFFCRRLRPYPRAPDVNSCSDYSESLTIGNTMAERNPAKKSTAIGKASKGFTDEERAAMQDRVQEMK